MVIKGLAQWIEPRAARGSAKHAASCAREAAGGGGESHTDCVGLVPQSQFHNARSL
jgi:hypothetical protein